MTLGSKVGIKVWVTAIDKASLKWPQDRPIEVEAGRGLSTIIAVCHTHSWEFSDLEFRGRSEGAVVMG